MTILTGCTETVVKTVIVSDFCEGRYSSQWLENKDFDNIFALEGEEYKELRATIYKLTDNLTYNEKEYDLCFKEDKQTKFKLIKDE